jgi:hypothetical protein
MYQSGRCTPNLQACIEEKEFNLKLAEEKKKVSAIQICRCTLIDVTMTASTEGIGRL